MKIISYLVAVALLFGCGTPASIVGTWKSDSETLTITSAGKFSLLSGTVTKSGAYTVSSAVITFTYDAPPPDPVVTPFEVSNTALVLKDVRGAAITYTRQ